MEITTNSSGAFNSGMLIPGDYSTRVTARGFKPVEVLSTVLVGYIATVNADLEIGDANHVIEVEGSALRVNTEQPTLQGVLNEQQIENLPVNGRNFLDLAQLEPVSRSRAQRTSPPAKMAIRASPAAADLAGPPLSPQNLPRLTT
jgi:hypothetical protein